MNDAIKMQISAFVDGELPQNEAELLLRRLCQDKVLRQQAAEYLAMGRVMRGERSVAGMATLRDRILAELDDNGVEHEAATDAPKPARFARPLAGAAIAATVALAALLGLQNLTDVPEGDSPVGNNTFAGAVEVSYTVPEQEDDLLREYYLRHNASSSSIGINSVNSRLVTLQLRDGVVVEHDTAEEASDDEPAESEAAEAAESTAP